MKLTLLPLLALTALPATSRRVWKRPTARDIDLTNPRVLPRGLSNDISNDELPLIMVPNENTKGSKIMRPSDFSSSSSGDNGGSSSTDDIILPDVLGKERGLNVFASFTRDTSSVSARLSDPGQNTTVLAPTNAALQRLERKPWESGEDYSRFGEAEAYEGTEGEGRAKGNLRRFVELHVVPVSPWREGERVESLAGEKVWWEKGGDGSIYIQPANVEVEKIATQTTNGEVWVINGVVGTP